MTIDSSGANSLAVLASASRHFGMGTWVETAAAMIFRAEVKGYELSEVPSSFAVHRRFPSPAGRRSGPSGWPMHAVFWANPQNRAPRPPLDSAFEGAIGFGPPVLAFPNSAETEEVCDGGVQADLGGFSHRRAAGHVYRAHRAEVPRAGAEDGAPQDPERQGI